MHIVQHLLLCIRTCGPEIAHEPIIAYVAMPDAIRAYGVSRASSHFTYNDKHDDIAWLAYPADARRIDKAELFSTKNYHNPEMMPCALGNKTVMSEFFKHNDELTDEMKNGIIVHLFEDLVFDDAVRKHCDASRKYEDIYIYKGQQIDGKAVRDLAAITEQAGIAVLLEDIYDMYGVLCNNQWIKNNIINTMRNILPDDICDSQEKYAALSAMMDSEISEYDKHRPSLFIQQSELNGSFLSPDEWRKAYNELGQFMKILLSDADANQIVKLMD